MKNIDFLPDIYRQRRVLRHARFCWVAVAMLFGLAIAGAASGQWYFRCSLAAQLKVVEPQHAVSEQRQAEIKRLEESKQRTEELAALYLYLEHPWPRTQLLAAVARSLPPSIQLTDLRMLEQADGAPITRSGNGDTNQSTGEGEQAGKPTAKSVLSRLRGEHDRQILILELSGQAANSKELHEYVDSLARSPLIASASLKGLEAGGETMEKGASKFHVRAIVRPGHGQPGAPTLKAGAADVAASDFSASRTTSRPGGSP
ncbi:MAG: PilN domain-containing protein [Pirellulaceae bacterium]